MTDIGDNSPTGCREYSDECWADLFLILSHKPTELFSKQTCQIIKLSWINELFLKSYYIREKSSRLLKSLIINFTILCKSHENRTMNKYKYFLIRVPLLRSAAVYWGLRSSLFE